MCWGPQREELIRAQKESDSIRETHLLEMAKGEKGGHAKCFGARILEIVKASKGIKGDQRL